MNEPTPEEVADAIIQAMLEMIWKKP